MRSDQPVRTGHSAARARPAKRFRTIRWSAVAIFLLGTVVITVTLASGQDLRSLDMFGAKFEFSSATAAEKLDSDTIEESQPDVENQVRELEARAQEGSDASPAPSVDLTGTWTDSDGSEYLIQQFGSEAVFQENSPYGVTAYGIGSVSSGAFSFDYEVIDGSFGTAQLTIVDSRTLEGTFTNYLGGSVPALLRRR